MLRFPLFHRYGSAVMLCWLVCAGCDDTPSPVQPDLQPVNFIPHEQSSETVPLPDEADPLDGPQPAPDEAQPAQEPSPETFSPVEPIWPSQQALSVMTRSQVAQGALPPTLDDTPQVVPLRTTVKGLTTDQEEPTTVSSAYPLERQLPTAWQNAFAGTKQSGLGANAEEIRAIATASRQDGELQAAVKRAQQHTAKGAKLIERGAYYSGREEFLLALQSCAEALDRQHGVDAHRRALQAGLLALEELGDFVPKRPDQRIDAVDCMLGHQTAILSHTTKAITAEEALYQYSRYAHEQLTTAGGDLLTAADAFFALGKIHLLEAQKNQKSQVDMIRAATLFQAAMVIEPNHALAANELGVIFVRQGKLDHAKQALQHSASLAAHPMTWKNLAAVHELLGEGQLAQLAQRESQIARDRWSRQNQAGGLLADGEIRVVDQQQFARSAPVNTFEQQTVRNQTPPTPSIGASPYGAQRR